ncbi:MAG: hypothetical protein V9G19_14545 [Tetrasphaera sp.]
MGHGIVNVQGRDPVLAWAARLQFLGSPALTEDLQALLSGEPLYSRTGEVEVSWMPQPDNRIRITVRRPSAPMVVDLDVSALTRREIASQGDAGLGSADPVPQQWQREVGARVTRWQLFNARAHSLAIRSNKP